jgi:NAD(P)-dependent dehydrogenase (short-subunit alcohol dehydrogenase family)
VRSPPAIPRAIHSTDLPISGIGLESSLLFAQEGANVLLVDINLDTVEKSAALVRERYPNVKAIATKADVAKEEEVKSAVDLAVKELGRLDIMVCRRRTPSY